MLVRDGEVDVSLAVGAGVACALHEVLLHGRARPVLIAVEAEQALRQLAVVEAALLQQVGHDGLVSSRGQQVVDSLALILQAGSVELGEEGKLVDVVEKLVFETRLRGVVVGVEEGEQILEHAAGSARGGYKLRHLVLPGLVGVPLADVLLALGVRRCQDAMTHGGCGVEPQKGESALEIIHLLLQLLFGNALGSNLLQVLLCQHILLRY